MMLSITEATPPYGGGIGPTIKIRFTLWPFALLSDDECTSFFFYHPEEFLSHFFSDVYLKKFDAERKNVCLGNW
jgi:hypothetical protein